MRGVAERLVDELQIFLGHPRVHQQLATTSFLIEILPGEVFLRTRDACKNKLDGATDNVKETFLEVALMVRSEDSPAGVLAWLRELPVMGNGAARKVHHP